MKKAFILLLILVVLVFVGGITVLFNSNIDSVTHTKGSIEKYYLFEKMLAERQYNRAEELNGITKLYYLSGSLKREIVYKNGKMHGISKYYSKDGQLVSEDHYRDDEKILHRKYDSDGNLADEETYEP